MQRATVGRSVLLAAAFACVSATPAPTTSPSGPIYSGNPATRFALTSTPLGFDADGNARLLVVAKFFDARGAVTRILANSDVDWRSNDGYVQWQTRLRYGQPSAIVSTNRNGPVALSARALVPAIGTVNVRSDTRMWSGARVVATTFGSHAVQIGWFPREPISTRVVRIDGRGRRTQIATIAEPNSSFRDTSVHAGAHYRYVVYRSSAAPDMTPVVAVPRNLAPTPIANASGKAMWLFFTSDPRDDIYVGKLDPNAIVAQAVDAGLHYVELRTAYGAYWEITPQAKPIVDAIVDGLAQHGIKTIGWTVPRDTSIEDLSATVRTAYYRTSRGTPLAGVAIDLERGDEFMGDAPQGNDALWQYADAVRDALGPSYLIVATVEDPYLEHITQANYPYAQIARTASVLQPMSYWRMMRRKPTSPDDVRTLLTASYAKLMREANRHMPVSMGGQTDAEGRNGYPSAQEITASLQTSRAVGAIGICYFSWLSTQPDAWNALAAYRW